ncbi:hypothetical protein TeGR_g9866 [Tetraparma gracilis]|jgi:serine/threonine protein phosphatase PrpC|uniref:PPM-type phosphatase domain-containing protein n=1 Tax=Tetraparma gracilis TaxID=2962635 RepID=A0ABQ6MW99_9STRA|nr:hypothetical protein TeGR_g9866 [Tetraparma gracilis]
MSVVHRPDLPDELARIEQASGWITSEREICIAQLSRMDWEDPDVLSLLRRHAGADGDVEPGNAPGRVNTITRVCGELAVSRAIGDVDFKSAHNSPTPDEGLWEGPDFLPYPDDHSRHFTGDLIVARGSSITEKIAHGDILVLVCDGVSDVMDTPDIAQIATEQIRRGRSAEETARRLCDLSIKLGSSDNVTAVVVHFA